MINLKKINKIYDTGSVKVHALKDIDLHIERGEFASIVGSSGSGKSTMMNILGCLDYSSSGLYTLDGEDVTKLDDDTLARFRNTKIGFVFQSFNLLPKLTALQNVELPMIYAGMKLHDREIKAKKALDIVGLSDRMDHRPNQLSGGQKQRVAIARALVNDPAIILADEPTGNLDSVSEKEIIEIFKKLNEDGVTIVLVTHEPEIAKNSKRAITFKDGRIISDEFHNI